MTDHAGRWSVPPVPEETLVLGLTFFLDSVRSGYTGNPKAADSTCETEMPGCQRNVDIAMHCNAFDRAHGECRNRRQFAPRILNDFKTTAMKLILLLTLCAPLGITQGRE